jgi:uncharacterized protein with LGFP repeats
MLAGSTTSRAERTGRRQRKAFELYGDIGAKWHALNAELSFLGYPLNAENNVGNGRFQNFQRGQMFWTPAAATAVKACFCG